MKTIQQIENMINILKNSYQMLKQKELFGLAEKYFYYIIALNWVLNNDTLSITEEEEGTKLLSEEEE